MDLESLFAPFEENECKLKTGRIGAKRKNENKITPGGLPIKKKKTIKEFLDGFNLSNFGHGIEILKLDSPEGCTHEVAKFEDTEYQELKKTIDYPAKVYKFELDAFQRKALLCLESNQSVLVSAHTSAGKTVVAEYAIAMCLHNSQKVIYTTPIKALSNQKFCEFAEEFGEENVGLMTGDVTTNPQASCLVMTTEILRNMLFKDSDILDGIAWIIFDEVHYMRDKERGLVWEESIILLSDDVRFVFLSATIPNARQFARWVTSIHKQPCNVIYTDKRPVPLEFRLYPIGEEDSFLAQDYEGKFYENNFNKALNRLEISSFEKRDKKTTDAAVHCASIVRQVKDRNWTPAIVFTFSKDGCESNARQIANLDLNDAEEKKKVSQIFKQAIEKLSEEDRNLNQVKNVEPLLRRGIGIHHAGLLPLVKEVIEVIFSMGLIKVLFATETFAMGLNMPARTVLFSGLRKFDGDKYRWVTPGEFIQMSGRAGRRGKDTKGNVLITLEQGITPAILKNLLKGSPEPLNSAYYLTYNMVLSLLRRRELRDPASVLSQTFLQFQKRENIPQLLEECKQLMEERDVITIPAEEKVRNFFSIKTQAKELEAQIREFIMTPQNLQKCLHHGRLVTVQCNDLDFGWAFVLQFEKVKNIKLKKVWGDHRVEVLVHIKKELPQPIQLKNATPGLVDGKKTGPTEMRKFWIEPCWIEKISAYEAKIPEDLEDKEDFDKALTILEAFLEGFRKGFCKLMDPVSDMKIKDPKLEALIKKQKSIKDKLSKHPLYNRANLQQLLSLYDYKKKISQQLKSKVQELQEVQNILFLHELKARKAVCHKLGYLDSSDIVTKKGNVACEIVGADELLLTEMLFNSQFCDLDVHQTSALLSCFVCQEKKAKNASDTFPNKDESLEKLFKITKAMATKLAQVSAECDLEIDETIYIGSFQPYLMEVVYEWSKGVSFVKILEKTKLHEGSIVRSLHKLEDLLRQLGQAASIMGNPLLQAKFSQCAQLLRRDIVFAGSLYL